MTLGYEKQAIVNRILNFSCVDGPGNRLVIFLQGCNFKCLNCHNPYTINHCNHCAECVAGCPTQALSINSQHKVVWDQSLCTECDQCLAICPNSASPKVFHYKVSELLALIRKQHYFLSGITVSGGEATMQLPFIIELFKAIKADEELKHLTCFIDTNGYLAEAGWLRVLPFMDGAMIDLKAWQNETHQWLVGRDNHRVIHSIRLLASAGKLHELRLLHIPGKSDLDQEIVAIAKLVNSLPNDVKVRLNAFQHHGVVGEALTWEKCSQPHIEQFHQLLQARVANPITLPSAYN